MLTVLASIAAQTIVPPLPPIADTVDFSYRSIPYLMLAPSTILATIATPFGIVALLLRDRARAPAIIGTTLGVSHVIIASAGMLATAFLLPMLWGDQP